METIHKKNINLLNTEGKLINIGFQKGSKGEIEFNESYAKRLVITGSTLRIRDDNFKKYDFERFSKKISFLI